MDNNKKNKYGTMEIDSIIREAKGISTDSANSGTVNNRSKINTNVSNKKSQSTQSANFNDNFVIYDDDSGEVIQQNPTDSKSNGKSKGKKIAVISAVVAGILIVVGVAGFCIYNVFSDFTYASNVYVNDICIGGMTEQQAKELLAKEETKIANNINIQVKAGDKTVALTKDDFEYTFDTENVLKQAYEYTDTTTIRTGEQRYKMSISLTVQSCVDAAKKVSASVDAAAADAKIESFDSSKQGIGRFNITDSKVGIKVKQSELTTQLSSFVKDNHVSGELQASADTVEPKYSKKYLQDNIKQLSTFSTVSTNDSNGNSNMALSLSKCNGSIIDPGETWSFNSHTGNSNLESNGYKPAGVLVNGKHTTGVGGGICQSSTTIYNAALLCGMKIVERSCHYYQSSYVDAGRDATVDYGNLDLQIKNIFDYQLVMECYMDGATLYCNIYGLPSTDFDKIEISSSITSYFAKGYKAAATRTYYLNGQKVKSEELPSSTYYTSAPEEATTESSSSSKAENESDSSVVQSDSEQKPDASSADTSSNTDDSGDNGDQNQNQESGDTDVSSDGGDSNTPNDSSDQ